MGPTARHEPPPTELARGRLDVAPEVVVGIATAAVLVLLGYVWLRLRRARRERAERLGPPSSKRASLRPPKPSR